MAALKWLVHSACHVLGYEQDPNNRKIIINNNICLDDDHAPAPARKETMQPSDFQMPLHYPRYSKSDYEKMEEWRLDLLLKQYGLSCNGPSLDEKRAFAMGAFLWPDQF